MIMILVLRMEAKYKKCAPMRYYRIVVFTITKYMGIDHFSMNMHVVSPPHPFTGQ
jgi:hypothetical protein